MWCDTRTFGALDCCRAAQRYRDDTMMYIGAIEAFTDFIDP